MSGEDEIREDQTRRIVEWLRNPGDANDLDWTADWNEAEGFASVIAWHFGVEKDDRE